MVPASFTWTKRLFQWKANFSFFINPLCSSPTSVHKHLSLTNYPWQEASQVKLLAQTCATFSSARRRRLIHQWKQLSNVTKKQLHLNCCFGNSARHAVAALLILSSNHRLSFNGGTNGCCEKVEAINSEPICSFALYHFFPAKMLIFISNPTCILFFPHTSETGS